MDRVIIRGFDGGEATRVDGGWVLDAERRWIVDGDESQVNLVLEAMGAVATRVSERIAMLRFGNAIGRYRAGPLGQLDVRSGKWRESDYDKMLEDISRRSAALPFQAGATSALPFERTEIDASDVLYHAFVWLRHALTDGETPLLDALRHIVVDPHRRMIRHERVVATATATRLSARALDEIASGVRPLQRVGRGRGVAGLDVVPTEVSETVAVSSVDTAENRFVLAFLRSCIEMVDGMRRRMAVESTTFAARVRAACDSIEAVLVPVVRHRVWRDAGPMHFFPASSTVLQRRSAYREVLRHHVLLRMASRALPLDEKAVSQLLEVKDIAKLYELWSAFAVIEAVRRCKGEPASARAAEVDDLGAKVAAGLLVRWRDGTEVGYNTTYSANVGAHGRSWSVLLRPDVTLWVPTGPSRGLHLFDAKFRRSAFAQEALADRWVGRQLEVQHLDRASLAVAMGACVNGGHAADAKQAIELPLAPQDSAHASGRAHRDRVLERRPRVHCTIISDRAHSNDHL